MSITMQVADVTKVLGSVRKMMDANNRVVFDSDGGYILHKPTGRKTTIKEMGNAFIFSIWVKREQKEEVQVVDDKGGRMVFRGWT